MTAERRRSRSAARRQHATEAMGVMLDASEPSAVSRRVQNMGNSLPTTVPLYQLKARLPPFPAVDLTHAVAFDGELYSKAEFAAYYGDAHAQSLWDACQKRTHAAACFVHLWFHWTQHQIWCVASDNSSGGWNGSSTFGTVGVSSIGPSRRTPGCVSTTPGKRHLRQLMGTHGAEPDCHAVDGQKYSSWTNQPWPDASRSACVLAALVWSQRLCYDRGHAWCAVLERHTRCVVSFFANNERVRLAVSAT